MKHEKTGTQSFLHGALVLTVGMALVKVIGALFKVPLKYSIGEYGMGLFNMAYSFYGPVFSLATAGFPVAVSRLVSESRSLGRWNDVRRVRQTAFPIFLAAGGAGMALLALLAPAWCASAAGTPEALAPILALAPAIVFACLGSVYRGYYAGLQDMVPTAASEVIEALVKLVLGLALSRWAASAGAAEYAARGTVFTVTPASSDAARLTILSFAAAGAVLGVTAGSGAALLYLALRCRLKGDGIPAGLYRRSPAPAGRKRTARRLLRILLPIAAGSLASNVAGLIDAAFLQGRLRGLLERAPERLLACFPGMIPDLCLENPSSIPTFLYGCYTLAMTVYLLVPAVTQAIGVSALPSVTEAWTGGDRKELSVRMRSVTRLTAMVCFPAGLGLSALAEPIVRVLYGEDSSGPIISKALALLGIASLAAALCAPTASMLQAVGRADLPVKLLFCAMGIKLAVNWALCGLPEWNIYGAAVGTLLCYLFLAVSQFYFLQKASGVRLPARKLFLGPLACAALCGLTAGVCFSRLRPALPAGTGGEAAALGLSVLCGAVFYVMGLFLLGLVEENDVKMLPGGQKIAKTLEKWGWI